MTDITPTPPSARAKLGMTVVDVATIGVCFAAAARACETGPVIAGVTAAAVTLPMLYSGFGVMARHTFPSGHPVGDMGNITGMQVTGRALKNMFSNVSSAAIATAILGVVGLAAGGMVHETEENTRHWQEIENRPTLPGDTMIPAQDLCGGKRHYATIIPYTAHDGKQYKILCP